MSFPDDATISYASFADLWKRLVSKRKARKFGVDRDGLWAQIAAGKVEFRRVDDREDERGESPRDAGRKLDVDMSGRAAGRKEAPAAKVINLAPAPLPMRASKSAARGTRVRKATVAKRSRGRKTGVRVSKGR